MSLKDKVVIVTGAAQGLGQEFALRMADEGAHVVVADLKDAGETLSKIKEKGGKATYIQTNVADEQSVKNMADTAGKITGEIWGLINNAAIYAGLKLQTFDEIPAEEWDRMMAVNAKGTWLCCKYVWPYMKEKGGSIVNIASASIFEGHPHFAHYVASKGAVWALTRSISRNLGQYNIRVNSVTPGYTMTQASREMAGDPAKFEENMEKTYSTRAIQRLMQPGDVPGAVLFLLDDGSAFITGQNINVDGGSIHY